MPSREAFHDFAGGRARFQVLLPQLRALSGETDETQDEAVEHTQTLAAKLREQWVADGLKVRPGVSDAELVAFEAREGIRLPEGLRLYLRVVNGMADGETDEELVEFLSLDRMAEQLTVAPDDQSYWLIVAQYCFHARVFALRATNEPALTSPVYPLGEHSQDALFGCFTELLEVYLSDPEGLVVR